MDDQRRVIDLTHVFDDTMPVYPGDPVPEVTQAASLEADGYNVSCLKSGLHVGTHIDAPLHVIDGAATMADFAADRFIGRGRLVDARGQERIGPACLAGLDLGPGDIVLVLTGWSARYRKPDYHLDFPEVTADFARILLEKRVSLLGLDTPSPDRSPFPVHKLLLGNDVLIAENLTNLEVLLGLPDFEIIALPGRIALDAAPARVVARLPS